MREIKFRAWVEIDETHEMVNWESLHLEKEECGLMLWIGEDGNDHFGSADGTGDFKLMQYTGRIDKYGQEIYEGDIVKRFGERPWVMSDGSKKYSTWSVEFKYGQWQLRNTPISPALSYTHFDSNAKDLIIIGNIYEHTHLLEEKK